MKKSYFLYFFLILILSACRKDIDNTMITDHTPDPTVIDAYTPKVQQITASVLGFITDENNQPIVDATVKMGTIETSTDNFGHFRITNADMNALGTFITVQKTGYFDGSRRFFPIAGATSRINIELLEKNYNYSFETQSGGTIDLIEGGSVKFAPNSIKTSTGDSYSGTVYVAAKWMDPTSLNTFDQMPGNLQGVGISTLNEEVTLGTYGMIGVELEGSNGEKLNIADGEKATITMPIPASMQSGAPSEIILWSFNDQYGIWVEESTATKEGNNYIGDVSHFSFWNCDVPFELIQLTMTLNDENGNPIVNQQVVINVENAGCGAGYTDENGTVSGLVPAGEVLTIEVFDVCGNVLYSESAGAFNEDTDLGILIISNPSANNTVISGELLCDGDPVANGIIVASFDGQAVYHYVENTEFEMTITTCPSTTEISVRGYNVDDLTQSDVIMAIPGQANDIGTVDICAQALEYYWEVTINGTTTVFAEAYMEAIGASTHIRDQANGFNYLEFYGLTTGNYGDNNFMSWYDMESEISFDAILDNVDVTEYGSSGGVLYGTFSGATVGTPEIYNISGSFRLMVP